MCTRGHVEAHFIRVSKFIRRKIAVVNAKEVPHIEALVEGGAKTP